jgi:thiol:disulfide interchange protein DsbD
VAGLLALGLLLVVVLAGCGPSGNSAGNSAQDIDANWSRDRLAEVEQTYANQEGIDKTMRSDSYVSVSVEGIPKKAVPGREYELTLVLEIAEGWHINANPATFDFLIPTRLSLEKTPKLRLVSVQYPKGREFRLPTLAQGIAIYEKTVRIPFRVAVARVAQPGTLTASGRLAVQACDDNTCLVPSQMPVPIILQISGS